MDNKELEEIKRACSAWWYCDNIVNHRGQVGLLRMAFPRCFILMRDYGAAYFSGFEDWKDNIIELNFLDPKDRETTDVDSLLTEAWNFLALQEREEDNYVEEMDEE